MARSGPELLAELQRHGVSEPAGRIYLVATREGPLPASELARATAVHRVHAYRCIQELVRKGCLNPVGRRPMRFAALPVDQLLDRWIHEESQQLEALRNGRDRLLAEWRDADGSFEPTDGRRFSIIEGQDAIHRFLKGRFGAARKELLITVSGFSLPRAADGGLDRALSEARKRGVKVRLVSEVEASNRTEAKLFAHVCELRHARRPVTNRAIVVDHARAAIFVTGAEGLGSGEAQVMLWTSDPRVVALAREYHRRLWASAVPIDERFVELENPNRAILPIRRGDARAPFERLQEIAELGMNAAGVRELRLDLPELIETVARQIGRQVGEEIDGDSPQAVARSLSEYYSGHSMGRLDVFREKPLILRVRNCFACRESPEIGRVLCPSLLSAVLERRLGTSWTVSKPDPTRHAERGCHFAVRAA